MAERDLQRAARRRQNHTQEPYQEALAAIRAAWARLDDDLKYVLSDDVQAFMRGEGWRGVTLDDVEDLRSWLANRNPVYLCEWCSEDGDARREDTSLHLIVSAYDPDLSPVTGMIASKRYHARCQPSKLVSITRVDIPRGPRLAALPSHVLPEVEAEIAIRVQPVIVPAPFDFELEDLDDPQVTEPALLITAEVTDDRGQGAGPWLTELEHAVWRPAGFDELMATAHTEPGWSVRVVDGHPSGVSPQWVAIRMSDPEEGSEPNHLYLGGVDLPGEWSQAVRGQEKLLLLAGPLQIAGEAPEIPLKVDAAELVELLEEGVVLAAYAPVGVESVGG